jgi:hypothetical protein
VDLDEFLRGAASIDLPPAPTVIYSTGIGGLLALCVRARGHWTDVPLILQAPVLWGLEHRLMPRVMRLGLARFFDRITASRIWQNRFARTRFQRPLSPEVRATFFQGFAECTCGADFFYWLTPTLLRTLEKQLAARPALLDGVSMWWGGCDRVVGVEELRTTELALGKSFPLRMFDAWGHYPMIDAPDDWVQELNDAVATFGRVPERQGTEAP